MKLQRNVWIFERFALRAKNRLTKCTKSSKKPWNGPRRRRKRRKRRRRFRRIKKTPTHLGRIMQFLRLFFHHYLGKSLYGAPNHREKPHQRPQPSDAETGKMRRTMPYTYKCWVSPETKSSGKRKMLKILEISWDLMSMESVVSSIVSWRAEKCR